jgi:hypothetical protein
LWLTNAVAPAPSPVEAVELLSGELRRVLRVWLCTYARLEGERLPATAWA